MPNTTNDTNENKITLLKRTKEEGKAPDNLQYGELAINYHEGTEQLYIQNHSDKVVPLIPKKISDLEGSSDYITEEDLEEYTYDKQEISDMISTATGGGIVAVNATGVSPLSLEASVSNGAANISGSVDLTGYATTAEIPTKVSGLTNDSGYITNSALNNYYDKNNAYSKTEVDSKLSSCITKVTATGTSPLTLGVNTTSGEVAITGSVDLTDYATTAQIPNKVSELTNDSGYIKSVGLTIGTSNLQYVITVDGISIGTIDIPASQVLTAATYSDGYLILTFTIGETSQDVKINLTDLINTYTNGNGLNLSNNVFSIKISSNSEDYIKVDENGLSINGIDSALNKKQDQLTAGDNITITQNTTSGVTTISAKDTTYSAGSNIQISSTNVISATDTTYSEATTSSAGLMSASDKTTLNSLSSNAITSVTAIGTSPLSLSGSISNNQLTITGAVGMATASSIGAVKPYYVETPTSVTTEKVNARYYSVGMNSSGNLYTCVPWNDTIYSAGDNVQISEDNVISATDTTYSAATESSAGLMSASDKTDLDELWNVFGEAGSIGNYLFQYPEMLFSEVGLVYWDISDEYLGADTITHFINRTSSAKSNLSIEGIWYIYQDKFYVMALDEEYLSFTPNNDFTTNKGTITNTLENYYTGIYDGRAICKEIISDGWDYTAVKYCNTYNTTHINAGSWWLPSISELRGIMRLYRQIDSVLDLIRKTYGTSAATKFKGINYEYMSCNTIPNNQPEKYPDTDAFVVCIQLGGGWCGGGYITQNLYVRPITLLHSGDLSN